MRPAIGGKVASIGGRLLDGAARVIIGQFFAALARQAGGGAPHPAIFAPGKTASLVRRAAMKPAAFDYVRAEHLDEALDGARPRGRRCAHHRRRPIADADAQHAPGQAQDADRHHAPARIGSHRAQEREHHASGPASARRRCWHGRSLAEACGSSRWRCPGPAMPRREAGARCADRSRMRIPAPNCRWCCWRSAARCICAAPNGGGACRPKDFFAGMMATEARRRRIDRGGLVSSRSGASARFVKWRAATAILPSSPVPRSQTDDGVRLAVGGVADMPAAREFPRLEASALDDALERLRLRTRCPRRCSRHGAIPARSGAHDRSRSDPGGAAMSRLPAGQRHAVPLLAERQAVRAARPSPGCC